MGKGCCCGTCRPEDITVLAEQTVTLSSPTWDIRPYFNTAGVMIPCSSASSVRTWRLVERSYCRILETGTINCDGTLVRTTNTVYSTDRPYTQYLAIDTCCGGECLDYCVPSCDSAGSVVGTFAKFTISDVSSVVGCAECEEIFNRTYNLPFASSGGSTVVWDKEYSLDLGSCYVWSPSPNIIDARFSVTTTPCSNLFNAGDLFIQLGFNGIINGPVMVRYRTGVSGGSSLLFGLGQTVLLYKYYDDQSYPLPLSPADIICGTKPNIIALTLG